MSTTNPVVLGDPTAGRKRKKKSKKCKLNSKAKGCRKSSRVAGRDVIGKKATVVNVRVGDSGGGSRKASAPPIAAPTFVTFAPPPQAPPATVMEAPRPQPAPIQNHYHYPPAERNEVAAPQEVAVPRQSQQPVSDCSSDISGHWSSSLDSASQHSLDSPSSRSKASSELSPVTVNDARNPPHINTAERSCVILVAHYR